MAKPWVDRRRWRRTSEGVATRDDGYTVHRARRGQRMAYRAAYGGNAWRGPEYVAPWRWSWEMAALDCDGWQPPRTIDHRERW